MDPSPHQSEHVRSVAEALRVWQAAGKTPKERDELRDEILTDFLMVTHPTRRAQNQ